MKRLSDISNSFLSSPLTEAELQSTWGHPSSPPEPGDGHASVGCCLARTPEPPPGPAGQQLSHTAVCLPPARPALRLHQRPCQPLLLWGGRPGDVCYISPPRAGGPASPRGEAPLRVRAAAGSSGSLNVCIAASTGPTAGPGPTARRTTCPATSLPALGFCLPHFIF